MRAVLVLGAGCLLLAMGGWAEVAAAPAPRAPAVPVRGAAMTPAAVDRTASPGEAAPGVVATMQVAPQVAPAGAPMDGWRPYDYRAARKRQQGPSSGSLVIVAFVLILAVFAGYALLLLGRQRRLARDWAALRAQVRAAGEAVPSGGAGRNGDDAAGGGESEAASTEAG